MVGFRVFGAPRFSVLTSQHTYFKGLRDLWAENRGAPKMRNPTTTDPTPFRPSDLSGTPLLWPLSRYTVSRTVSQQIPAILEMSRGCRATSPIPTKKRPCRTYLATPMSLCRGKSLLQKRIAFFGGVAATLTPMALHCATKSLTLEVPLSVQSGRAWSYAPHSKVRGVESRLHSSGAYNHNGQRCFGSCCTYHLLRNYFQW